jgi:two-component system sensor histidine kinase/response regulator
MANHEETTVMPDQDLAQILIVDDEAAQMKALCDTLRDEGYATTGFASAKAALHELRTQKFDLILTDLMMPEMDGITLLRSALETDPNLIGIIMTGEGTISSAVEAMKTGALDYILKPFKLSAILPVLSRALAVRRLRMRNAVLEQRVRERTAELEAANRDLESFCASVSHDLRAPLRHIDGFSNLLIENHASQMPEEARRLLKFVSSSAQRMGQLIDDLLHFSRLGRQQLSKQPVNISGLVQEVLEELGKEQGGRSIEIRVGELPDTVGDPSLLKQVFVNLFSNAFKFTRQKEKPVMEVGWRQQGGEGVYFVRDNGVGFNMDHARKLFGVFQRLHTNEEFEGTGVGLSIVQRIIHRHGGRIWAEAGMDKGAAFFFTLPG